jgi:hypothetical protein
MERAAIIEGSDVTSAASSEPGCEARQGDHEHALLAEHVAEPARDRRHHRRREEIGGEDPRDTRGGGVQVALQHRQSGHHQRLKECVRGAPEREHAEDEARPRGVERAMSR